VPAAPAPALALAAIVAAAGELQVGLGRDEVGFGDPYRRLRSALRLRMAGDRGGAGTALVVIMRFPTKGDHRKRHAVVPGRFEPICMVLTHGD